MFSGRTPVPGPRVLAGGVVGEQISLRVLSIGSTSSGTTTHSDTWEEVCTGLEESSSLGESGAPRATDTGLFWVEFPQCLAGGVQCCLWQECTDVSGHADVALCFGGMCHGKIHVRSRCWSSAGNWGLGLMFFLLWTVRGPLAEGWAHHWVHWCCGASDPGKDVNTGTRHPFSPSGYTTWVSNWRSWQTSSWLRNLQALLLGALSIMMLICP